MEINQSTSLSLLDRLQQPDNDCDWELFLSIYRPFLRRQLLRCGVRSRDVDDVLQESLAEMLIALPGFRHNGHVGAFRKWMKTIVARKAHRFQEQHKKNELAQAQFGKSVEQFDDALERIIEREHDTHVIRCLLDTIQPEFTETTWSAFKMQVVDEKKAAEVAEILGRTTNAVLISKSRVLRRLRQLGKGIVGC